MSLRSLAVEVLSAKGNEAYFLAIAMLADFVEETGLANVSPEDIRKHRWRDDVCKFVIDSACSTIGGLFVANTPSRRIGRRMDGVGLSWRAIFGLVARPHSSWSPATGVYSNGFLSIICDAAVPCAADAFVQCYTAVARYSPDDNSISRLSWGGVVHVNMEPITALTIARSTLPAGAMLFDRAASPSAQEKALAAITEEFENHLDSERYDRSVLYCDDSVPQR